MSGDQRLFPTPKGMMARIADLEDEVERLQEQAAFANDWRYALERELRQLATQTQRTSVARRNTVSVALLRAKMYAEEHAEGRARKRREEKP